MQATKMLGCKPLKSLEENTENIKRANTNLLWVVLLIRKESGDMEHDLDVPPVSIHTVQAS